ncbi:MAG TPA: putative DNA binding domain-containing protein, partial [Methanocorpusculum sp.]|nr:putative DNA binding domain-containing protein [Methanocorpusculum sp.]
ALGNAAVCEDKDRAYLLWGIQDDTHEIVGTDFNPYTYNIGNEELENWLRKLLSNNVNFEFRIIEIDEKKLVLFTIQRAIQRPITFKKNAYIRSGSYKKLLRDVPSLENRLWSKLNLSSFEKLNAIENLDISIILKNLDYISYFDLTGIQQPVDMNQIIYYLAEDELIHKLDNGQYSITNLGALLFSKNLSAYPHLSRKCLRIIQYNGNSRLSTKFDTIIEKGYAVAFQEMIRLIMGVLPTTETLNDGIRVNKSHYPEIIIRELLANALIHQDFTLTGVGPMIEIFNDRIEITNPGTLLVDEMRIIDNPPKSRNESLAALMRRCHICEEAGSGWDKIITATEKAILPAPRIMLYEDSTRIIVYDFLPLDKLSSDDKIWACYLHACLKYSINEMITNTSLRERFGLHENGKSAISRIIKSTINNNLIKVFDADTAPRYMKYVPYWA